MAEPHPPGDHDREATNRSGAAAARFPVARASLVELALVSVLVIVALIRIVSTYRVFNHTYDEPGHIAVGMEWIERGTYTFEHMHPPLARIAAAVGPYMLGQRLVSDRPHGDDRRLLDVGNAILYQGDRYQQVLSRARAGILPFFLIAVLTLYFWVRHWYGGVPAVIGVLLFTDLPPVLAHAGLATTDVALLAGMLLSWLAVVLWLERPTAARAMGAGAAAGVAILAKFTALPFLALSVPVLAAWYLGDWPGWKSDWRARGRTRIGTACPAVVVGVLMIWAGYRFSLRPVTSASDRPHAVLQSLVGASGPLQRAGTWVLETVPIPAPEFVMGIRDSWRRSRDRPLAYLNGETSPKGFWWFFPVGLLVKTPIPVLILGALGAFLAIGHRKRDRKPLGILVTLLAILGLAAWSRFNIGLRHILPVYGLLAFLGALGGAAMLRTRWSRLAAIGLLIWLQVSVVSAGPDYLAYFNELGAGRDKPILVDSDLDWGQDLNRLAKVLQRRHVDSLHLEYFGSAEPSHHGIPPFRPLEGRVSGWVALSESDYYSYPSAYAWLDAYHPVERAGRSIRVYFIPPDTVPPGDRRPLKGSAPPVTPKGVD